MDLRLAVRSCATPSSSGPPSVSWAGQPRPVVRQAFNERLTNSSPSMRGRRSLGGSSIDFLNNRAAGPINLANRCGPFSMKASARACASSSATSWTRAATRRHLRLPHRPQHGRICRACCRREIAPTLCGRLKLVDLEDDDVAEITVSKPLLARYQAHSRRNHARTPLYDFCAKRVGVSCLSVEPWCRSRLWW